MTVHKRTGHRKIAKEYDQDTEEGAQNQFEMMLQLKSSSNILSYEEYIVPGDIAGGTVKIIAPYLEGAELLVDIKAPDVELAFIVFKQIAHALETLEKYGVIHHDVNEHTIILKRALKQYKAYLTEFSNCSKEKGPASSFRYDLSCLASTVERKLPRYGEQLCCEPAFRSLLSRSVEKDISASEACVLAEDIAPGYIECPFKTLYITKKISIKRIVDRNNVQGLRLLDFLRIVLYLNARDTKFVEKLIKRVIWRNSLFELADEIYCYLEDAEKILHHMKSQDLPIWRLDLDHPIHPKACWYETTHSIDFSVSYHKPSQMINISQVLNLCDDSEVPSLENILPAFQELRGSPQWEGYYIDKESSKVIFERLGLKMDEPPENALVSSCVFRDNDSEQFGILATQEMVGFIFLNCDNKTLNWNGSEYTVDDAIEICTNYILHTALGVIREGLSTVPLWISHYDNK